MAPTASEYPLNAPPHALLGGTDSRKRAGSGEHSFCKADLTNYSIIMKERYKEREEYMWKNMKKKDGDIIFFGV